ncbi:hypothetical protein ACR34G_00215 [Mycoplasma sp. 480]|uniref:hypothetical protein n=1 Tax=Mycoplasma sp. 480 TaxID=3440155 RepID=UPI003F5107B8
MKPKIQIERRIFYTLIILLSISNILLLLWLLDGLILGTNAYDNLAINSQKESINNFLTLRYVGYISNSLILVGYLVNILVSRRNGVAYLFGFVWITLFIGVLLVPYFSSGFITENWIRLTLVIIWSIIFPFLILINIYLMFQLRLKRQNYYYEKIKIHKGGR